jgi:NADH dehydrogenase FAD-containing subunit
VSSTAADDKLHINQTNEATARSSAKSHVTLIDRRNHHLFQALLYQVATGMLSAGQIAPPCATSSATRRTSDWKQLR